MRKASHELDLNASRKHRTTERIFCYDKRQSTSVVESKCFSSILERLRLRSRSTRRDRVEKNGDENLLEAKNRGRKVPGGGRGKKTLALDKTQTDAHNFANNRTRSRIG